MGKNEENNIKQLIEELEVSFKEFDDEYLNLYFENSFDNSSIRSLPDHSLNIIDERKLVTEILSNPYSCAKNCQDFFTIDEIIDVRQNFRLMSCRDQRTFIIGKLQTFLGTSEYSLTARQKHLRVRKKYDYFINADRPVCRQMFLFYHGESIDRLKRRQKYLAEVGTLPLRTWE